MNTLDEVRAKCRIDKSTGCWIWRGAGAKDGVAHIHTIDYARKTKRTMSGATAVWNIAHGESPPPGCVPYRFRCGNPLCLNPAHLRLARGQTEVMRCISLSGRWKGTHLEQRRAAAHKGLAAQGMRITPEDVVRQILAAEGNNCAVAKRLGVHHSVVSRVRRSEVHRHIDPATRRSPARDLGAA